MIKLDNVTKVINKKTVLKDIKLSFDKGKIYLLTGHNGCGKTMLLRLICGLISPDEGKRIEDEEYRYGVIIENPSFFTQETAMYNLKYLATINNLISKDDIEVWLNKFNLLENKADKVKTFSLGMKQRLSLCQAFMENPDVLLLDEPFNAIDEENLMIIYKLIEEEKKKGKLIVIASHSNLNDIKFDEIIKMRNGTIVVK